MSVPGILNLIEPCHLLAKLERELQISSADHSDSDAAIDTLRDAYRLREWLWHDRLKSDQVLQVSIMGTAGNDTDWNAWVNRTFSDFPIIRELCNGSKHFEDRAAISATHRAGWDSKVGFWDNSESGWDDKVFTSKLTPAAILSVISLVTRVRDFWTGLFQQFPRLG